MKGYRNWILAAVVAVLAAGTGYFLWLEQGRSRLPDGIAGSNGRIEAEQIQIATKLPGRVVDVLPREGDMVNKGDVLARMDPEELEAQLRAAKAQVTRAEKSLIEAQALVAQRDGELVYARQELTRTTRLHGQGFETTEKLDLRRSALNTAEAAQRAASAGVDVAHAAIEAAKADARRLATLLEETVLTAPHSRACSVSPCRARRSAWVRRQGSDVARSERCLHDRFPACPNRGTACGR